MTKGQIIEDYMNGESLHQIGSDCGVGAQTIRKRLHSWGIALRGRTGMIYIIAAINTPYYKLGFTTSKSAQPRMANMQSSCPYELKVVRTFEGRGELVERRCHEKLAPYWVRGEWFERCAALERLIDGSLDLDDFLEDEFILV